MTKVNGYKTYALLVVGALAVLANAFLGIEIPGVQLDPNNWLDSLFALGVGGTIRHGIR